MIKTRNPHPPERAQHSVHATRGPAGFTLVELLIVVVILGIIGAVVVTQLATTTDDSRQAALVATLASVRRAIELYKQEHGVFPGLNSAVPPPGTCTTGTPGTGTGWPRVAAARTALSEQLTTYTAKDGGSCSVGGAPFVYGPYLRVPLNPNNPITGRSDVLIVGNGDLMMKSAAAPAAGWKYDVFTGKFIADDPDFDHL